MQWKTEQIHTRIIYMTFQTIGSYGKHVFEKVTLTVEVNAALCKSTFQLSGDTSAIWESKARLLTQSSHQCFSNSTPKDEALTEKSTEKVLEVDK